MFGGYCYPGVFGYDKPLIGDRVSIRHSGNWMFLWRQGPVRSSPGTAV